MATYTIKLVVAGDDQASGPIGKAKGAVDGLGESSEKSGPKIRGFAEIATGALRRMGELATEAAVGAAGAIAGFVADSISQAGNFEAGMNRFGAVVGSAMGESGQSLESFKQLFLDLGASTQYSAAQAQEAAINLAKGGIDPATLAAGGLEAAMNLAAAGELDLAEAAEISAKQFGVWVDASASASEKAAFLAQSADLLAQAANASTVDVGDLALGMANVGGVAKLAGASFGDTVQAMAMLAPGFSSAADAGTSFKTFLSRLIPSTDAQAEAMANLGLLTSEGTSRFYDAEGSFIGMEGAAQLLQDSLAGLTDEQKQSTLQTLFGSDAIRAAAIIAENGAAGFQRIGESMAAAGTAAEQAAARQQGFNFAMDSAKGSLETFGIVAGSLVLPALTALLNDGFIPAVNAVTSFVGALGDPSTTIGAWALVLSEQLVPGLMGLAAATLAYALTQLPTMIAGVMASTTAFMAQAAAIAATLIPLAAIGIAVAGVAIAWNDFTSKVSDATSKLLESREWWNQSTLALQAYSTAQLQTNADIAATAATIEQLRTSIQSEIDDLGRRMAAGLVSEAQYANEMAAINAKASALQVATGHLNAQIAAENAEVAASMTATSQAATLTSATADMGAQASLTAEDIQQLGEKITATYEKGGQAVAAYAETEAEFLSGVEERRDQHTAAVAKLEAEKRTATTSEQKKAIDEQIAQLNQSYADQETAQATSYAEQQAAQRAHLGQMLIDYTVSQAQLGNISSSKAAEITAALEKEYGLQESSTASTFLNMASSIDAFANDSSASIDTLISSLGEQESAAVETEQAMTAMSKEYVAEAVANFVEKGGEAEDYASTLRSIPSRVETEVHTKYTASGNNPGNTEGNHAPGAGRALGGQVSAGQPYTVGETGAELFVPDQAGRIVSAGELEQLLRGSGDSAPQTSNTWNVTIQGVDTRDAGAIGDNLRMLSMLYG